MLNRSLHLVARTFILTATPLLSAPQAKAEDVGVVEVPVLSSSPPVPSADLIGPPAPALPLVTSAGYKVISEERALSKTATSEVGSQPRFTQSSRFQTPVAARLMRKELQARANRMEAAYLTLSAIDTAQTIYALRTGRGQELNPLFGRQPSTFKILGAKSLLGAFHYIGFRSLNRNNPKAAFRVAALSALVQGGVVGLNMRVVLK